MWTVLCEKPSIQQQEWWSGHTARAYILTEIKESVKKHVTYTTERGRGSKSCPKQPMHGPSTPKPITLGIQLTTSIGTGLQRQRRICGIGQKRVKMVVFSVLDGF
jgi:hypothetical protein